MNDVNFYANPGFPLQPPKKLAPFPLTNGRAIFMVGLSAVLYGFLGYFGTQLLNHSFSLSAMLFWRFLVATVWMMLFGLVQFQRSSSPPLKLKNMVKPFFLGALLYSGGAVLFFMACRYAGTGLAMVIFFSYPLFVALLSWFTNSRSINKYSLISMAAIFLGLVLLKGQDSNPLDVLGILFGVSSALCYAIYVFCSNKILAKISSGVFTTIICGSCALLFLVLAALEGDLNWPASLSTWAYTLALGILATALPIQLLVKGMQVTGPFKASIISVLEPVVTVVVGVALLDEFISPLQIIGVFIVIAGAIIVQFEKE